MSEDIEPVLLTLDEASYILHALRETAKHRIEPPPPNVAEWERGAFAKVAAIERNLYEQQKQSTSQQTEPQKPNLVQRARIRLGM
jgi:hypothetical protein